MSNGQLKDPDDFFAETRMSFGDHIEELRTHLWKAIYGFLIALFFSFFIGNGTIRINFECILTARTANREISARNFRFVELQRN